MSIQEKRKYYECGDKFRISEEVPSWQVTGLIADIPVDNEKFEATVELNKKVGLWFGDITQLELDAIVCSVPSAMNDVREKAGHLIDMELTEKLQRSIDGEIVITAGYYLPAKYVFHTKDPITSAKDEEQFLQKCYLSALKAMTDLGLKTLAFPCISMGVEGLHESVNAKMALETTRIWLQENHSHVEKIVFCVFDERNWQAYQEVMPTIFPVRATSAPKSATLPTEILRMDSQSIQLYKKALSEGEFSVHSIRVMVVGHHGVGKTTLTRLLLGENIDNSALDSTNGIDVHVKRCRVSLADQSWTVLNEDKKLDTVYKKLAEVLSRKSSNEDESLVKEAGLDDAEANCNNSTSGVETNTELKEVAHSQCQAAAFGELKYASDVKMFVDTNDSVRGGDVEVTSSDAILKDLKELISNTDASDDSDYADLSVWDFAGQSVFYTTHQMFLSSRAVYLLVTDISKHINDIVGDDDCYFDSKGAESYKISDFVNFWLNSIHGYCPSDKKGVPPVILVCTHADALNKSTKLQQEMKYFEALRKLLAGSVSAQHVVNTDFSIDKDILNPNLDALKNKIYEVASQQDNWGKMIPAKWLTLEHALSKLRNKGYTIITREKLQDVNDAMPVPISSEEELNLFLRFHHESGNILYFDDLGLRDNVVLDPQWLVDCLKSIITAKDFCLKNLEIFEQWQELYHKGILRPSLIEAVWCQDKNKRFWDQRGHLILLMEKLDIIAQCNSDSNSQYHLVPCMLKKPPNVVYDKSVSTPVLCITMADGFLSAGIFQRLIAECIVHWQIVKQGKTNLIYCGYGCFKVGDVHRMTLYFRECVIQLWVSNYSKEDPHPATNKVCTEVRDFVRHALERINKCLGLAQLSDLELSIKCPLKDLDDVDTRFKVDMLLEKRHKGNTVICDDHDESHPMNCDELLRDWYCDEIVPSHCQQATPVLSQYVLEKFPTDKQIFQIAKTISKKYKPLGMLLGLSQMKIEEIQMDYRGAVNRAMHIFLSWRRDNVSPTFRVLEQAMRDVSIETRAVFAFMK